MRLNKNIGSVLEPPAGRYSQWVQRVIALLDAAIGDLCHDEHPAKSSVHQAASLLRAQVAPGTTEERGRLLAWQVRRVREYIDDHLEGPISLDELSAVIQRSKAHFSRNFTRTFGTSPHMFILQRRLELAAQYLLETDKGLIEIALRCGFCDQAHFCRRFKYSTGFTPAAWRRAFRIGEAGNERLGDRAKPRAASGHNPGSSVCLSH